MFLPALLLVGQVGFPTVPFPKAVAGFAFGSSPKTIVSKCERAGGYTQLIRDEETGREGIRCSGVLPLDPFNGTDSVTAWFCPSKKTVVACMFNLTFEPKVTASPVVELLSEKYGEGKLLESDDPTEDICVKSGSWSWRHETKGGKWAGGWIFISWLVCDDDPKWDIEPSRVYVSYMDSRAFDQHEKDRARVESNF